MTNEELKRIEELAGGKMLKTLDSFHDYSHVNRVRENALKIVEVLGLNNVDRNLLQAICLLHDLTYTKYKRGMMAYLFEGVYIKKILLSMRAELDMNEKDFQILLDAAEHHPHSFPFRILNKDKHVYCKILQDSDTLDFFGSGRLEDLEKMKTGNLYQKMVYFFGHTVLLGLYNMVLDRSLNYSEVLGHFKVNV